MLNVRKIRYEISSRMPMLLHMDIPTITMRGAFGYSLAQILESDRTILSPEKRSLLFRDIFKPRSQTTEKLHNADPARPYVMRGSFTRPDNKSFMLEICLFGEAVKTEPIFDKAVENMARMGLGAKNTACRAVKIVSEEADTRFPDNVQRIMVEFITPARLSKSVRLDDGSIKKIWMNDSVPFPTLFARLVNRLDEIMRLYSPERKGLPEDCLEDLKKKSFEIDSEKIEGGCFKTRRISGRTEEKLKLDGFVGKMLYSGDFSMFAYILGYLPWVHVGKAAALGCGWTTIECVMVKE